VAARGKANVSERAEGKLVCGSGHGNPAWASNILKRGLHARELGETLVPSIILANR
jgi:hypothetical protein